MHPEASSYTYCYLKDRHLPEIGALTSCFDGNTDDGFSVMDDPNAASAGGSSIEYMSFEQE